MNLFAKHHPMLNVLSPFFHFWTSSCTVESHRFKESSRGKHNDRAMTTLYQLKLTANGRLTNMAASHALRRGHRMCWKQPTPCFFVVVVLWNTLSQIYICLPPIANSNSQKNIAFFFSFVWHTRQLVRAFCHSHR